MFSKRFVIRKVSSTKKLVFYDIVFCLVSEVMWKVRGERLLLARGSRRVAPTECLRLNLSLNSKPRAAWACYRVSH